MLPERSPSCYTPPKSPWLELSQAFCKVDRGGKSEVGETERNTKTKWNSILLSIKSHSACAWPIWLNFIGQVTGGGARSTTMTMTIIFNPKANDPYWINAFSLPFPSPHKRSLFIGAMPRWRETNRQRRWWQNLSEVLSECVLQYTLF